MSGYLGNFIDHGGQLNALFSVAVLWLALTALGAFIGGPKRLLAATPFYGWALVSIVFTLGGVFTAIPFTAMALLLAALAIPAGVLSYRRDGALLPPGFFKVTILALPLLVLVSAVVGSQWDEFSNWLSTPRLLLEIDTFPTRENAHRGGNLIAYPFGWHFINYLASLIAGYLLESAGALSNVLMLLLFSFVSIELIKTGMGREHDGSAPSWKLCAVGILSTTVLSTTFAQKVVLTAYADVSTSTLVGLGAVVGWYMLGALAEGKRKEALQYALQTGLLMMVLVNLKQSTVVLAVLVVGGVFLAGLRDPKIRFTDLLRMLPGMVVPAVIIYGLWRYYVSRELPGGEMSVLPFSKWLIEYIPQILQGMLLVLSKKGAFFILLLLVIGFGIKAMVRYQTSFDRFALIAGAIFLGHNAFLLFSYVAAFGKFDALRVASYWRYNMQLGMLGVAFMAYGAGILWHKYGENRRWADKVSWLPVTLIILAPFIFADKLRFDRVQPVPHYRAVGKELKEVLTAGNTLLVLDPRGSGESAVIARFELGGDGIYKSYLSAYHPMEKEKFRSFLIKQNYSHILVYSQKPEWSDVIGTKMDENHSYLLEANGSGGWKAIKDWKKP